MLFLAHILNRPVVDAAGRRLGWVEDLVLTGLDLFPKVEAIVLARRGQGAVFLPWDVIEQIDRSSVHLKQTREQLSTSPLNDEAIFLRRDILDKQVVDIHGRRVVRVNDLQLVPIDHELRLIGADIGVRGLLRRLGLERPVNAMAHSMRSKVPDRIIPWNYVEGIETEWPSLRLNVSHRRLRELPATDIADILTPLRESDRAEIIQQIDDETIADTLPHLEEDIQAAVIMSMSDERASDILEILPPDEAADVLGDIAAERAERILHLMEPEEAEDVRELLRYDDETAGGRMTTEYIALSNGMSTADALVQLRREAPDAETIYYVYMVDEQGKLEGVLSLRDLITATDDTPISQLARRNIVTVCISDDQETVAHTLNHYHLLAVPVVDESGVLHGIVTVDDVLDVLHEEAEEDISRSAGAIEETDIMASPWEQVSLRLPWALGAGVAGMFVALFLVIHTGLAHSTILPLLALLPIMVLLGAHIGGQGAATAQVALGDGEEVSDILQSLAIMQWPIGLGLSLAGSLTAGLFTRAFTLPTHAIAVSIVVFSVLLIDMLAGGLLPILMHRMRWDPILISRPALAVMALVLGVPLLALAL